MNANARMVNGQMQYPTMYGADGWYGWQNRPWDVGALEVWYWSQKPEDLARVPNDPWLDFLQGKNPTYPETAAARDLQTIQNRLKQIRADTTPPSKRLADNMLDMNPVVTTALTQLTQGGLQPGRDGGVQNARLRYFDPDRRRAGLPEDTAALITEMTDTKTMVTLVNVSKSSARTLVVQGGAFAEHQIQSVAWNGRTVPVNALSFTVKLPAGAGRHPHADHEALRARAHGGVSVLAHVEILNTEDTEDTEEEQRKRFSKKQIPPFLF